MVIRNPHHILVRSTMAVHPAVNGTAEGSSPSEPVLGEYSSGQRGQTVNLLINFYEGSNPSSPIPAILAQR